MRPIPVGDNIRRVRTMKKLTQTKLAQLTGMPQPSIAEIEARNQQIRVDTLVRLAKGLGCSPMELLADDTAN